VIQALAVAETPLASTAVPPTADGSHAPDPETPTEDTDD